MKSWAIVAGVVVVIGVVVSVFVGGSSRDEGRQGDSGQVEPARQTSSTGGARPRATLDRAGEEAQREAPETGSVAAAASRDRAVSEIVADLRSAIGRKDSAALAQLRMELQAAARRVPADAVAAYIREVVAEPGISVCRFLQEVVGRLGGDKEPVACNALLGAIGTLRPSGSAAIRSEDLAGYCTVLESGLRGRVEAWEAARPCLDDRASEFDVVRQLLIGSLGRARAHAFAPRLRQLIETPDESIGTRAAACEALAQMSDAADVRSLVLAQVRATKSTSDRYRLLRGIIRGCELQPAYELVRDVAFRDGLVLSMQRTLLLMDLRSGRAGADAAKTFRFLLDEAQKETEGNPMLAASIYTSLVGSSVTSAPDVRSALYRAATSSAQTTQADLVRIAAATAWISTSADGEEVLRELAQVDSRGASWQATLLGNLALPMTRMTDGESRTRYKERAERELLRLLEDVVERPELISWCIAGCRGLEATGAVDALRRLASDSRVSESNRAEAARVAEQLAGVARAAEK